MYFLFFNVFSHFLDLLFMFCGEASADRRSPRAASGYSDEARVFVKRSSFVQDNVVMCRGNPSRERKARQAVKREGKEGQMVATLMARRMCVIAGAVHIFVYLQIDLFHAHIRILFFCVILHAWVASQCLSSTIFI